MKICFATYPSVMILKGGPRTQIFQTKAALEEHGVQVTMFNSWEDFHPESFDLVHVFGANIGSYHFAREFHKLGIPMAVSPIFFSRHSPLFVRAAKSVDGIIRAIARGVWTDYGLVAEICRWSSAVLPNTGHEADLVHRGLGIPPEKITVIPNGVEKRFRNGDPSLFVSTYGISNFILNVGHIGPVRKNVLRLINALERIRHPAVIIGRVEDNDYARKCAEAAKRNERLLMLDSIAHDSEMLASAYAAADLFALPSTFETPGIAALEAGLAGAKIVITPNGGTKEYFGSYAEYVEPSSEELIHHGIVTALNKPKNSELRDHIAKEFLWESVGKKTKDAYERMLP
ncbi:MAG TPA: glycosyltransferase [Bacteroidota bacterium]|nr:glycosyltransferase [Bacteroidota bacterium]